MYFALWKLTNSVPVYRRARGCFECSNTPEIFDYCNKNLIKIINII